jgi:hypothetical protein
LLSVAKLQKKETIEYNILHALILPCTLLAFSSNILQAKFTKSWKNNDERG